MRTITRALALALLCLVAAGQANAADFKVQSEQAAALTILNSYINQGCQDPAAFELRADILRAAGNLNAAESDYQTAAKLTTQSLP